MSQTQPPTPCPFCGAAALTQWTGWAQCSVCKTEMRIDQWNECFHAITLWRQTQAASPFVRIPSPTDGKTAAYVNPAQVEAITVVDWTTTIHLTSGMTVETALHANVVIAALTKGTKE